MKNSVVFIGDNESGKTTLIAKLQGVEDPKKGSGLEFAYIDVRDDYRDGKIIKLTSILILHFKNSFRNKFLIIVFIKDIKLLNLTNLNANKTVNNLKQSLK